VEPKQWATEFEKDVHQRLSYEPLWNEIYELMLPGRRGFYQESQGDALTSKIFDETAVVGIPEFVSRFIQGMMPKWMDWIRFIPGPLIKPEDRKEVQAELDPMTSWLHSELRRSNYYEILGEAFTDLCVGTSTLVMDDEFDGFNFSCIPQADFYQRLLPDGRLGRAWRYHKSITCQQLRIIYPDAKLPEDWMADTSKKVDIVEGLLPIYNKRDSVHYEWLLMSKDGEHKLEERRYSGAGSCPWISFGWTRAPGEHYFRGPAMNVLPAVKTANLTMQIVLENAAMSMVGMWQGDDDGMINPDTIEFVPGTTIMRLPGSRGLEPLTPGGSFDVSNLILGDMRHNIRKGLYNETLGPRQGTPASATEVAQRMNDLAQMIGSPIDRIFGSLARPVVDRAMYFGRKRGEINMPRIDGKLIAIQVTSPLARVQANENLTRFDRFGQTVAGTFGPAVLQTKIKQSETIDWLGELLEIPAYLIRNEAEQKEAGEQVAQAAGQAQDAGIDPMRMMEQMTK